MVTNVLKDQQYMFVVRHFIMVNLVMLFQQSLKQSYTVSFLI